MKRKTLASLALIVLFLVAAFPFPVLGDPVPNPLIVTNDYDADLWELPADMTATDDYVNFKVGETSVLFSFPLGGQWKTAQKYLYANGSGYDISGYDRISFWFKGTNTGYSYTLGLRTSDSGDIFAYWFTDTSSSWQWFTFKFDDFTPYGGADLTNIKSISVMINDNCVFHELNIDYMVISLGQTSSQPPETPVSEVTGEMSLAVYCLINIIIVGFWVIGFRVWNLLGLLGGLVGGVLTAYVFSAGYLIMGSEYVGAAGQWVHYTIEMGFFAYVPLLLTVLCLTTPFYGKKS